VPGRSSLMRHKSIGSNEFLHEKPLQNAGTLSMSRFNFNYTQKFNAGAEIEGDS